MANTVGYGGTVSKKTVSSSTAAPPKKRPGLVGDARVASKPKVTIKKVTTGSAPKVRNVQKTMARGSTINRKRA